MRRASLSHADDEESWASSSLWVASLDHRYPPLSDDDPVDVIVVGAGIAGLLTATLLHRAGRTVRVLDRHQVGGVATRNTTAKVSALQGVKYRAITKARGADVARHYATAQLHAVAEITQLIADLGIDCGRTTATAYTYATERTATRELREELAAAKAAGLDVDWTTTTDLPFPVLGAIRLDNQAHVDPGRLCAGLAAALPEGTVAEQSTVTTVDEHPDHCSVVLEAGPTLRAGHVVIATQGPITDPALLANRCTPKQSYCLAARLERAVPAGMYLSCDRSTRSLRPATVDGSPVLIVGGAGHRMGDPAATPERWDELVAWAREHFGALEVTHRWATHDLVPTDNVPFIGRLGPRANRRWVATGFAKWGMTNGYVAANLIAAAITGTTVDWAPTFDSTRIRASLTPDVLSVGATATRHLLVDRLTARREPRCSHQGCVLRQDLALGTWDCPCHGSRFDTDGTVIQGPATTAVDVN
jgi:glycine/D-amino acid oxidase-like deaminating enzyme